MINATGGFFPATKVELGQNQKQAGSAEISQSNQDVDAPKYKIDAAMDFPMLIDGDETD